jgi:hypothetical protein
MKNTLYRPNGRRVQTQATFRVATDEELRQHHESEKTMGWCQGSPDCCDDPLFIFKAPEKSRFGKVTLFLCPTCADPGLLFSNANTPKFVPTTIPLPPNPESDGRWEGHVE